ncbi:MAG: hypothetical protein OEV06_12325, partial [Anaerolineae bacterium]|nr:hypothetical protein [Anaerolineae bacterium]
LPIILMGIGLSFFQWLVLRRLFHRSGWWFQANGLGWAAFLLGWGFWSVSVFYDSNPGGAFLFFFAGAFIYSVATGYTLDWFMKHWKDEASTMIRQ